MASTALTTLTSKLAATLNMGDGAGLMETLKATAFKGQVSDAQMTALLVVANQYGLNPWTKEIYAFPDKNNGIVPVVGVDGWSRIINNHPQFDGMDFEQDAESCTCIIHRKDRRHPVKVTEYMAECRRSNVGPWQSHPRRMLRHKAMIQCARLAFGYGGIYDQDEAERIVEVKTVDPATGEIVTTPTFDLEAALADVAVCVDAENLSAVWKQHVALAQAARDKTGYAALKEAVALRGAAIKALADGVQDVDAKEVVDEAR
jgi:phage recombination protein Bet